MQPGAAEGRSRPLGSGKSWCVYLLRCADGTLYAGITNDLDARLRAHRRGSGARYTRGRLPLDLVYREEAASRAAATRRELQVKRLSRAGKLALIGKAPGGLPGPAARSGGRFRSGTRPRARRRGST